MHLILVFPALRPTVLEPDLAKTRRKKQFGKFSFIKFCWFLLFARERWWWRRGEVVRLRQHKHFGMDRKNSRQTASSSLHSVMPVNRIENRCLLKIKICNLFVLRAWINIFDFWRRRSKICWTLFKQPTQALTGSERKAKLGVLTVNLLAKNGEKRSHCPQKKSNYLLLISFWFF